MVRRLRIRITGAVQGVGFRPFIYRLAKHYDLKGFVINSVHGVLIEAEGADGTLADFLRNIPIQKPPHAFIHSIETSWLDPEGYTDFTIRESQSSGGPSALILPDLAVCADCLRELFDPRDRRYLYPFINCTNCGPRFTIIESLPYDRPNTTMKLFPMCDACNQEYHDPSNRRFHAQPNACPLCGPRVTFLNKSGLPIAHDTEAIDLGIERIRNGQIVAVKGIGGFHLMTDARNTEAILRLRERKRREEKPFAVMMPDLKTAEMYCIINEIEKNLLLSPPAPIVLLKKKEDAADTFSGLSSMVAPDNPYLGIMIPYSPLHHILMRRLNIPVVATSGNLSDEPICIDEQEALIRLQSIADGYLVHNRPIVRHADDSVVRVALGREYVLRRARGYAPLPVFLKIGNSSFNTILAVGAHLKNTVAVNSHELCFISQHIGDLDTAESHSAFARAITDLTAMYQLQPTRIVTDAHPDYASTRYAREMSLPAVAVQHHVAHIVSCMSENDLRPPVLGVAWDGTGYGDDGTIWGGEFILIENAQYRRLAHFRPFLLAGGDQAVKEPRRSALGILYEIDGDAMQLAPASLRSAFSESEWNALLLLLKKGFQTVRTSSAGRLFDAVAALINLRHRCRFEGQAAMELEFTADLSDHFYPFHLNTKSEPWFIDWEPMIRSILQDLKNGISVPRIASAFHNTLVEMIISVTRKAGIPVVVLSGGCFQNLRLLEKTVISLQKESFSPYWHQRVPANDGGIALGQLAAALQFPFLLKTK